MLIEYLVYRKSLRNKIRRFCDHNVYICKHYVEIDQNKQIKTTNLLILISGDLKRLFSMLETSRAFSLTRLLHNKLSFYHSNGFFNGHNIHNNRLLSVNSYSNQCFQHCRRWYYVYKNRWKKVIENKYYLEEYRSGKRTVTMFIGQKATTILRVLSSTIINCILTRE